MYTTTVGKTFLKEYNERLQTHYTARTFFEEVFVPLFFDHQKYMMTAGNSPLENPKLSWDDMIKGKKPFETPEKRKERIDKMIHKVETERADASIAVGYGVLNDTAAMSSQITGIELDDSKADIYLSWVGAALGICISGGITMLFNEPELLWDLFKGWQHYRSYLEENPYLKGNQINTWNGQWIAHRYKFSFDEDDPTAGLGLLDNASEGDIMNISTVTWVKVLLAVANRFSGSTLVGYLYNIGQTNTTLGFIPFNLEDLTRPNKLYQKIFGEDIFKQDVKAIEELYGTAFGIRTACQYGSIGVRALEPKGLKSFIPEVAQPKAKYIIYKENDNTQRITFNTYLIWILAMLNNEQLWDKSRQTAQLLLDYEAGAGKARKDRTNKVHELLDSVTPKQFFQNLVPIIKDEDKNQNASYEELGKIILTMPKDNFPFFNTLIRFQYALLNK